MISDLDITTEECKLNNTLYVFTLIPPFNNKLEILILFRCLKTNKGKIEIKLKQHFLYTFFKFLIEVKKIFFFGIYQLKA